MSRDYVLGVITIPVGLFVWLLIVCAVRAVIEWRGKRRIVRRFRSEAERYRPGGPISAPEGWNPPSAALVDPSFDPECIHPCCLGKRARTVPEPLPKRGGYSGSRPASEVPPPPSTPSATIRPRTEQDGPRTLEEFVAVELDRAANAVRAPEEGEFQMLRRAVAALRRHMVDERARLKAQSSARVGGQLRTPGPDEPVTENLSAYIDGEIRRGAMWSDGTPRPTTEDLLYGKPLFDSEGRVTEWVKGEPDCFVHVHGEGGMHPVGSRPCCATPEPDWPDPDKHDCPVWLPQNPAVPFKDRTPCRLDSGHDEPHEPMDQGTLDRANAIAKTPRPIGKPIEEAWDDAAAAYDAQVARSTPEITELVGAGS